MPISVRYHPSVRKRELQRELPAVICAVDDGHWTKSVSVMWLEQDADGVWRKERTGRKSVSYGPVSGRSVKIGTPRDGTVIVAEGVETAASAAILYSHAAEAVIGKENISAWHPPDGVHRVIVAADNDEGLEVGDHMPTESKMDRFAERARELANEGYTVAMVTPNHGRNDFNDMLLANPDRRVTVRALPFMRLDGTVVYDSEKDGPETVAEFERELNELVTAGVITPERAAEFLSEYERGYATA